MSQPAPSVYIETVGCQMNVLDSELVVAALKKQGYTLADKPDGASLILFNTCSVREHAEEKTYSALGRSAAPFKRADPSVVVGVIGCMAQKDQELIRKRVPYVDVSRRRHRPVGQDSGPGRGGPPHRGAAVRPEPGPGGRRPGRGGGQLRELRPGPRPADAADPVPGVRADSDRLRQVLHLLRGARHPRPRAEPAARTHPGRGADAGGPGGEGSDAARADGQQLPLRPRGRPHHPAERSAEPPCTRSPGWSGSSSSPTSRRT